MENKKNAFIIRNNQVIGSPSVDFEELTFEQYKTMEANGEIDLNKKYLVKADDSGALLSAEDVSYNEDTSVKGKIDNLDEKIEKHSLPCVYDSGARGNSTVEYYKLSNVNVGEVNLLLSTRFGDEVELSIGTTANNQYIQAKNNFNYSNKISGIHMDGTDLYVTMNTYFDYFRIYHKSGVLSNDFAVTQVSSVPDTATKIDIKDISSELKISSNTGQTNITMDETKAIATSGGHGCRYVIRNGICYVNMDLRMVANGQICTLQKPLMTVINIPMSIFMTDLTDVGTGNGVLIIESNGSTTTVGAKLNNTRYMLNFSYPIA